MADPSPIDLTAVTDTEAVALPNPSLLDSISKTRAANGRFVAGVAAATSSDQFKGPTTGKPQAKRWDHILSTESKARKPSSLKASAKYLKEPGLISLGAGLPCPDYFPLEEVAISVPSPVDFLPGRVQKATAGKHDVATGKSAYDLSIALNYGLGTGSAQLLRFVTEHTEIVCRPAYADWQCCLTVGNTSALEQAFRMFCERGDYILAEEYTFSSAVETALPLGLKVVGIAIDDQGLRPEALDQVLNEWDADARGAAKPHILYTIPTGSNPTGATQGTERRKAIYRIAQKHDLYILEDEPYYFLQMQPYTGKDAADAPPPASVDAFIDSLVCPYPSLDVDGRVMRMDAFSKVICPGSRVGWITASAQIVERVVRHNENSVQNPSGLAQIVLYKLLEETWGHGGYFHWLIKLRMEYTRRRDVLLAACEQHLPRDVATWDPPSAGMFLWIKIDWHRHPSAKTKTLIDIEADIFETGIRHGVLVCRGSYFLADRTQAPSDADGMFFRATFAAATEDKMTEAIVRFGTALRESFALEG